MAMNVKVGRDKESCGIFLGIILLEGLREGTESLSHCSKPSIPWSNPELTTKSNIYLICMSSIVIIKSVEVRL